MSVGLDAAAGEPVVDIRAHAAEVLVHSGIVGVGVGEPVVLVRAERELVARSAPEDEPGVVHRRRAVAFEGQLEEAYGRGVVEDREQAADRRRVDPGVQEVDEQRGDVARCRHELVLVASPVQRTAQRERVARLEAHEVAGRDHADHGAAVIEHRQMAHAARQHGDARLGGERVGADGVDRRRMMALTGASRETPPTTTFSRRSALVTMPSPSRVRTSTAESPPAVMSAAASEIVVSGAHHGGAPRTTAVTGSVCTCGSGLRERAAYSSASRWVVASQRTPSSRLSSSTPSSPGMQYNEHSVRARTENAGAVRVSRLA